MSPEPEFTATPNTPPLSHDQGSSSVIDLDGRKVMLVEVRSQGPLTAADAMAMEAGYKRALAQRLPIITILAASGTSTEDGLAVADAWGRAAKALVAASGIVPILFGACGPVLSGPALLLGLADVAVFTDDAYSFVSGPAMVQSFTGVPVSTDSLGGASTHTRSSGIASETVADRGGAIEALSAILAHLPDSVDGLPPSFATNDPLDRLTNAAAEALPATATGSYDVRTIIADIADDGDFLELRSSWAPNLVTGFVSLGGHSIGVVANQTQALAGSLDIPASQKGARFVSMCDAFNVPLLTLVDTSGFLPGKDLEWRGMIRHGAQMAFAYARATVPRVSLIVRKSYGGAYIVMDSRYMGNDMVFAWPSAEVAVMGAKGAVGILHRNASDDERITLEEQYEDRFLTPYLTAERGSISAVIEPNQSRARLTAAFDILASKRERLRARRHDNSPL